MISYIVEFENETRTVEALDEDDAMQVASCYGSWLSLMEDDTSWGYV
jgi:hypothetical protein